MRKRTPIGKNAKKNARKRANRDARRFGKIRIRTLERYGVRKFRQKKVS